MNARVTKPEFDCAIASSMMCLAPAQVVQLEAARNRDEAMGRWLRNALTTVLRAVVDYPRRRRVYDELSMLSDRELADIGLTRGDIPHVFETGAAAQDNRAVDAPAGARRLAA
ncbi:DUF1127 domain-containing protein [Teichococcus vastitatis]|uniref:DUF1127 domain-containing protein n=1 Tax=Teichococcus vastitatis TaxID=2307076 RepID=A0ABS9W4N1_9PROT|nr:DUF1127 domain-containing protein [Pseudoroseomonas vastitatis]MCI0754252.1 DUF1127 domain-containing protein [Pseudoroseomonas vastitatis]